MDLLSVGEVHIRSRLITLNWPTQSDQYLAGIGVLWAIMDDPCFCLVLLVRQKTVEMGLFNLQSQCLTFTCGVSCYTSLLYVMTLLFLQRALVGC